MVQCTVVPQVHIYVTYLHTSYCMPLLLYSSPQLASSLNSSMAKICFHRQREIQISSFHRPLRRFHQRWKQLPSLRPTAPTSQLKKKNRKKGQVREVCKKRYHAVYYKYYKPGTRHAGLLIPRSRRHVHIDQICPDARGRLRQINYSQV